MTKHETVASAVQAVPSVAIVGAHFAGLSLHDWAAVLGMAFIALQAAHLIWKWNREAKRSVDEARSDE